MLRRSLLQLTAPPIPIAVAGRAFTRFNVVTNRPRPFTTSRLKFLNAGQITTGGAGPASVFPTSASLVLGDVALQNSSDIESSEDLIVKQSVKKSVIKSPNLNQRTTTDVQRHSKQQNSISFVPKSTYEVANLHNLQISRVPGGHDRPRLFGDRRSQDNLRPDITLLKTSDMIRSGLERRFLALDEDLQKDLTQLQMHLADSFKEPGAVSLVWQRLKGLENKSVPIFLLLRIAIDRPRLFARILCQLRPKELRTTMSAPESAELMSHIMCYVYCILMSRHLQMALKMPPIYFEALQRIFDYDPNLLKVLPRYSLYRHCPLPFQKSFSETLQRHNLHQSHWEDDLVQAQRYASEGNWAGVSLHLGNVYELCGKLENHLPVRSVEFINTIGRIVGFAKAQKSNVGEVINAILPAKIVGEMQALVYSRLVRYALVENRPESSNLELILGRLPPRALSRSTLVDHVLNASVILNTKPPDHRLNSHLKLLLQRNNVLATYYLSAWHLYLINSQDISNTYNTMIRLYIDLFDTTVLKAIGLPFPKTKSSQPRLSPTHVTLNLMLNSYFHSNNHEPEIVIDLYRSFRQAVQAEDISILRNIMDGPRVYNAFLETFARFPEKDLHLCIGLVAEISNQITEERVKWSQDGQRWRKRSHIGPDDYSWCILLKVLSGHGHWEACTKILESIRKRYPKAYGVASNTVISALMKSGKKDEAVQILQRMMMLGYDVDEYTVRALNYLEKDVSITLDQATNPTGRKPEQP